MAKHTYTILSMMKDEGHSLVEWVAYHSHIGFDNIVVYTNNCSDGTDDMLIRLEEMGWVQHFRNDVPEGKKPQPNALSLASQNPEVTDSEWILTMDADEFLSIKVGRGWISDIVERMDPAASAMAITWRFFGSNGITEWNPGLVIENYTRAAPDMFKKGWGVKTLFKPFRDMKLGIHRPHIKKAKQEPENAKRLFDQLWLNGSGDPMPDEFSLSGWRSTKPTLGYKWAELNHYAVKSYEAYLLRRVRGNVNNKPDKYNDAYFAMFDRNEEEHTNVQRHLRGTKKRMAKILSDPVMRDLQDKALAFHRDRVRVLREGGEYDTWLAELKDAAKVPIDGLDEVLFVQHLPKEWQEKVKELQAQGVPDKQIAKMISQTQTAKKGETRQELLRAAGHTPEDRLDSHSFKARGEGDAENLDNPFMGTEAADGLGVPLTQERTQKIALAAQAAEGDDPRAADLLKKAEAAKKALAAEQSRRAAPSAAEASPEAEAPTTEATVDITDPAPPIDRILDAATLSVSEGVQSPPDTVPKPTGPDPAAKSGRGSGTTKRARTKSSPTKARGAGAAGSKSDRETSTGKAAKARSGGTSSGKASATTRSKSTAKSRTTKSTSRRSTNRSTSAK
jgi:hypothetical protein